MTKIKLRNRYFDLYLDKKEIDHAVEKVANELNDKYKSLPEDSEPPLLVCVLSGAYMFTSDLIKKLDFESEVTFIKISSYSGLERTNTINVKLDVNQDVKGRDIIVLDEILDSGNSLAFLKSYFLERGASNVDTAVLIYKPHTVKANIVLDHWGYKMSDDAFLVGYGLDYDEKGRTLPAIYALSDNQ